MGTTEDELVGWHHRHNGHGFGWTPGVGNGQGPYQFLSIPEFSEAQKEAP